MDKFQMPPPITSLFSRDVHKGISQDEFVIIDGRVMLPQESVAKFFDMSVRDVRLAVPFLHPFSFACKMIFAVIGLYYVAALGIDAIVPKREPPIVAVEQKIEQPAPPAEYRGYINVQNFDRAREQFFLYRTKNGASERMTRIPSAHIIPSTE